MKILKFIIVLFFPLVAFADGVMVSEYTLEAVKVALLVKVLTYDGKKGIAKIEILKKFSKLKDAPAHENDSSTKEINLDSTFDAQSARPGQIANVRISLPTPATAGKWVEVIRYWNQVDQVSNGSQSMLILGEDGMVFSPTSEKIEKKFAVLFDQDLSLKKLRESSIDELKKLLLDRDYEKLCFDELEKRNALGAHFISELKDFGLIRRIFAKIATNKNEQDKEKIFVELAKIFSTQNLENQRLFLQSFYYSQTLSIDIKISVLSFFSQKNSELQTLTTSLFYEVAEIIKKKDYTVLTKISTLFLDYAKYNRNYSSELSFSTFLEHLPEKNKNEFFEKAAKQFVIFVNDNSDVGRYEPIIEEFKKGENLNSAWIFTDLDFKKIHPSIAEPLFSHVVGVLLKKSDLHNSETKSKISKFCEPYLALADYPYKLTPQVKELYLKNGGVIYQDLHYLPLTYQENLPELAAKFTYYFEKAIFIEVLEVNRVKNKNTIKIKIHKSLGHLGQAKNGVAVPAITDLGETAKSGDTVLLSINEESILLLERLKFKSMILATKASSFNFLIFDQSYAAQIETFF